jgi:hypothetical protein
MKSRSTSNLDWLSNALELPKETSTNVGFLVSPLVWNGSGSLRRAGSFGELNGSPKCVPYGSKEWPQPERPALSASFRQTISPATARIP